MYNDTYQYQSLVYFNLGKCAMYSGNGVIIAIILGFVLGFRALYRLFKMKRYFRFAIYILFWFGYPLLMYMASPLILQIGDAQQRIWLTMPLIVSLLVWLFFGLMINQKVKNIDQNIDDRVAFSQRKRLLGLAITIVSFLSWLAGLNYWFGRSDFLNIVGSFIISCLFWIGIAYLATGKTFDEFDN